MTGPLNKAVALAIIGLVTVGGIGYYTYSLNSRLNQVDSQLGALRANLSEFKSNADRLWSVVSQLRVQQSNLVLLRTWGSGLASYGERADGITYLRLVVRGGASGVEAALATTPFNATIKGNSVEWRAVANKFAADKNHTFWPMVLENSPSGTDAIEFEDAGGVQEVAVSSHGVRSVFAVSWAATVVHTFKIVIVVPGAQVDFYIDGNLVQSVTHGVPQADFLLEAAELKGSLPTSTTPLAAPEVAVLDVYGGLVSASP